MDDQNHELGVDDGVFDRGVEEDLIPFETDEIVTLPDEAPEVTALKNLVFGIRHDLTEKDLAGQTITHEDLTMTGKSLTDEEDTEDPTTLQLTVAGKKPVQMTFTETGVIIDPLENVAKVEPTKKLYEDLTSEDIATVESTLLTAIKALEN